MNISKSLLSFFFLISCSSTAFADELTHRKLAEEFMVLTGVEQLMDQTFKNLKESQLKKISALAYPGKTPEKDKILYARMQAYLDRKLVWSNFRIAYTDVYKTVFSEEELRAMVAFYASPVGRKVQSNGLELRKKVLESTQIQLKDFGLEVKKIEKDFISEQKK